MTGEKDFAPSPESDAGAAEQARKWAEENAQAIACYNDYIEKNGLPLADLDPAGQARRWLEENADAIQSSNDYVEKNGLPFSRYRKF